MIFRIKTWNYKPVDRESTTETQRHGENEIKKFV